MSMDSKDAKWFSLDLEVALDNARNESDEKIRKESIRQRRESLDVFGLWLGFVGRQNEIPINIKNVSVAQKELDKFLYFFDMGRLYREFFRYIRKTGGDSQAEQERTTYKVIARCELVRRMILNNKLYGRKKVSKSEKAYLDISGIFESCYGEK